MSVHSTQANRFAFTLVHIIFISLYKKYQIFMKLLWIDLNSSYAHASLALPALHAQMQNEKSIEWSVISATINENIGMVVKNAAKYKPDIIAATAWLFNRNYRYTRRSRIFRRQLRLSFYTPIYQLCIQRRRRRIFP